MNPETPTPRTDDALGRYEHLNPNITDFARTLEREIIASREDIESLKHLDGVKAYCKMMAERDSLRQQLEEERMSASAMECKAMDIQIAGLNQEVKQLKHVNEQLVEALEFVQRDAVFPLNMLSHKPWDIIREALTLAREMGLYKTSDKTKNER